MLLPCLALCPVVSPSEHAFAHLVSDTGSGPQIVEKRDALAATRAALAPVKHNGPFAEKIQRDFNAIIGWHPFGSGRARQKAVSHVGTLAGGDSSFKSWI